MPGTGNHSRRRVLRGVGAAGAVGLTGVSGCIGSLTGGGGPIPMGSIQPITGQLSDFGEGMQASVELAEQHINDAGGPMGREVTVTYTDSETKPEVGQQKYQQLVSEESIVGFVGAASSGVTTPIAEQVASDEVMQVSHASTSPALAQIGYGDDDEPPKYFGRTAPNDAQQGILMGNILGNDDYIGADKAAFLHVDNPYGLGLAEAASENFSGETTAMVGYAAQTNDYTSTLDSVFEGDPDAVGFVGYPANAKTILNQWSDGGYGGQWVSSEGINSESFWQELSDITEGFWVTSPDPKQTAGGDTFNEAIGGQNTLFAAHAYDALFLQALAMHRAGEASGTAIAENIQAVATDPGEVVTVNEFQKGKDLIDDGTEINYQGASSPLELNDSLEPLNAYAILRVRDGATQVEEEIPRSFFEGKM